MTIEQAIKNLNDTKLYLTDNNMINNSEKREALCIAISALQKQLQQETNEPLSLEELKQMEGEPVYCVIIGVDGGVWEIIGGISEGPDNRQAISMCNLDDGKYDVFADLYGKTWLAYRKKVEV